MQISTFNEKGEDISPQNSQSSACGNVTIQSCNITGLTVDTIDIEVDISRGLPCFIIVGLPDTAVAEARDRVRAAIKNSGFKFPDQRVTVNLAPGNIRKAGSLFDLPIALGILLASEQIASTTDAAQELFCVGELSLHGAVRGIHGALPIMQHVLQLRAPLMLPSENVNELSPFIDSHTVYAASSLFEAASVFAQPQNSTTVTQTTIQKPEQTRTVLFSDIVGQTHAKRAITIAAAGGHNILLHGAPGVGKSMLAQALVSVLPAITRNELLETRTIHSVVGEADQITARPFRAPHHTSSAVAIIGGGSRLRPGEVSLAHNGVLFLDEFPEFKRSVIESLRQPLENGDITINRANGVTTYPARCILVAAMNPCPCGYAVSGPQSAATNARECTCSAFHIQRYQQKLSGPIIDRIDITVHVQPVPTEHIQQAQQEGNLDAASEEHDRAQQLVQRAYTLQQVRQSKPNAYLNKKELQEYAALCEQSHALLRSALSSQMLSMRGYIKTVRIARTIADIEECDSVRAAHIAEALSYTRGFQQN